MRLATRLAYALALLSSTAVASHDTQANVVIQWNQAALQAVRDSTLGPPMVARALAIVHTCAFDAWAAYDNRAVGTQFGSKLRRPKGERTIANKNEAISFAFYRAAVDLFPGNKVAVFDPLMANLGYDVNNLSTDVSTPAGVGNVACSAVLDFRHSDGSNQLGNLTASGTPYADYTGYLPVNLPSTVPVTNLSTIVNPDRWQPLTYFNGVKVVTPVFIGAQWYKVQPFANPYSWPLPMVSSTENPFVRSSTGAQINGGLQDRNGPPTSYQQPYFRKDFPVTQRFWFICPGYNNGGLTNLVPDLTIDRLVFQDTDNLWKYTITKSGYSNTVTLPNQ